jgi:hypothetical protein
MLVQLVPVYCLGADPSRCMEHRPMAAETAPGLMSCVAGAQPGAARWLAEHPQFVRVRYRCEMGHKSTECGA